MALTDVDRDRVLKAMAEFDELGRAEYLARYQSGHARRYMVKHDDKYYDPKGLIRGAHSIQFPDQGLLMNFSGGEAGANRQLRSLGFDVVVKPAGAFELDDDEPRPIAEIIEDVLELQHDWASTKTPEMAERGELIRRELPQSIRQLLPRSSTLPFSPSIEGQDGVGRKSKVPWVRVYSKSLSPSAMAGWYVVLLFAADGTAAYLALGTGVHSMVNGQPRLRPDSWLAERIAWARSLLDDLSAPGLRTDIDLADSEGLGAKYEKGAVFAFRYPAENLPDDNRFATDLGTLLASLSELYSQGEPDGEEEPPVSGEKPVHLLLKWNPESDPDTLIKHLDVIQQQGSVWWGNFTKRDRRLGADRLAEFRDQLSKDVPTYAFLYKTGPHPELHRAVVHDITNDRAETDAPRVPPYYGEEQRHSLYVRVSDVESVPLDWARTNLALASRPVSGSLGPALRNQTTPLYVIEVGPGEVGSGHTPALTTKEWLARQTLWEESNLDELLDVLLGPSPQVILAGPPGTGKSWVAQAAARYLTQDDHRRWRLVQFHPSYGYESFVEGLRPVAEEGGISFQLVPGTVLRMAEAARLSAYPHVLVLDELNRANIPRVLGELMFLFEYRNQMIDLQYSQGFTLPANLSFIATMNTADRSIRAIDVALRRRFEIFEWLPDREILKAFYDLGRGENFVPDLADGFTALNLELEAQLDRHHTIGQNFFMTDELTPARLNQIWARKLYPLIEEYFFDLPDLAHEFTMQRFWPSTRA